MRGIHLLGVFAEKGTSTKAEMAGKIQKAQTFYLERTLYKKTTRQIWAK
jgi:hypothetical protein